MQIRQKKWDGNFGYQNLIYKSNNAQNNFVKKAYDITEGDKIVFKFTGG